jgi:hypothetical protein
MRRTSPAYLDGEESGHGRVAWYIGRGGERDRAKSRTRLWVEYRAALELRRRPLGRGDAGGQARRHTGVRALKPVTRNMCLICQKHVPRHRGNRKNGHRKE